MITPNKIIKLINDVYDIDIRNASSETEYSNLRSIYFYLSQKYCNPFIYTFARIGREVNRDHSNALTMAQRCAKRLNSRGWDDYTKIVLNLEFLIKEIYSEDEDYLYHTELESYDLIKLKRELKKARYNIVLKTQEITSLSNKLKRKTSKMDEILKN